MKQWLSQAVRWLPLLLCAAVLLTAVHSLTPSEWQQLGEQMALLGVGLQSPRESVMYIEEQLTVGGRFAASSPSVPSVYAGALQETLTSVIPPKGDGGGAVSEDQIGGGTTVINGVTVKNSSGAAFDYTVLFEAGLPFDTAASSDPLVLIVHTHACECYMSYYAGYYNADDPTRTTDNTQNVVAVGEEIAKELRACGIGVVHDTTQHDHPAYSGAYTRSEQTILSYLQKYPSIRVVLDIHRDAMMYEDQTKVKPTVTVNGQKAAQMMIIVGATDTPELPNAHCEDNLRFGLRLHQALEMAHEGIMRPMYLVDARYNQGLAAGSLLVEVGTDANTLSEALHSGRLLGKQLAALFQASPAT